MRVRWLQRIIQRHWIESLCVPHPSFALHSRPNTDSLRLCQIIGAPSFFPTVWGWIKKWFDPITTSKIFILSSHQVLPTLATFIDIENIPAKYGGKLDFECGKMPVLDPQVRACLDIKGGVEGEKSFLTAPTRWIDSGDDEEMTAVGVGSIDGKERKEAVAVLHSMAVRVVSHAKSMVNSSRPATAGSTTAASLTKLSLINPPVTTLPGNTQPSPLPNVDIGKSAEGNGAVSNGVPPEKLAMPLPPPPPPMEMQRTKTEYVTPPSDPSEIKQLG